MIETKTYSAMLYALADELRQASPTNHPVLASPEPLEEAAERLDTLTVTIRGLEIQRDEWIACHAKIYREREELMAALENLQCVKGRFHTQQAYERLIAVYSRVKGGV